MTATKLFIEDVENHALVDVQGWGVMNILDARLNNATFGYGLFIWFKASNARAKVAEFTHKADAQAAYKKVLAFLLSDEEDPTVTHRTLFLESIVEEPKEEDAQAEEATDAPIVFANIPTEDESEA